MSKVMARVIAQAFDSTATRIYYPGDVVEIDSAGQLASLKTPLGKFVFEFPRPEDDTAKEVARLKAENAELARPAARK